MAHDAKAHSKAPDHHREDLGRDEVHRCIKTTAVEHDIEENEENSKTQTDAICAFGFDELGCHGSLAGEAEEDADAASDDKTAAAEAVDEEAIEKVAGHGGEVEEAEQEQGSAACDTEAREELSVVVVDDERTCALISASFSAWKLLL